MKIDLTQDDYRNLLDLLSISGFVLGADLEQPKAVLDGYEALAQKIYSYAGAFEAEHLVEFFPEEGKAVPTLEFEQTSHFLEVVEDYNDFVFWEELVGRLAEQDLIRDVGEAAVIDMPFNERVNREMEYAKPYWDEFEKHGLSRVRALGSD